MKPEYWGGYERYNELYQHQYNQDNQLIHEQLVITNAAIMMYSPFIDYESEYNHD